MFHTKEALHTIRELNFVRTLGSEGEARALEFLCGKLHALGVSTRYHCFEDWWVEPADAFLAIGKRRFPVTPAQTLAFLAGFPWMDGHGQEVRASGRLAKYGEYSTGALVLREECDLENAYPAEAAGQILMFDPVPSFEAYLWAYEGPGFLPSAYASLEHRGQILGSVGQEAVLCWQARRITREFRNLVAEIPGRVSPRESVVMGAHIDSFPGTVGSSDDAAGCAVLLEAAAYFAENPPDRTVKFVWFTGEELDRRGSRRFVEDQAVNPTETKLYVNVDSGFEQMTRPNCIYASDERIGSWTRTWVEPKEIEIITGSIESSDAAAFNNQGIPVFQITGGSRQPAHLPTDCPDTIDMARLDLIGRTSIQAAILAARMD